LKVNPISVLQRVAFGVGLFIGTEGSNIDFVALAVFAILVNPNRIRTVVAGSIRYPPLSIVVFLSRAA
jgi:hypothetical protein